MNNRERILAILDGRTPDRIPWLPRLDIWFTANRLCGTLPEPYRDKPLRQVERDVFGGTAGRDGIIYRTEMRNVEIRKRTVDGERTVTEYVTPVGTVSSTYRDCEDLRRQGIQGLDVEPLLKTADDYPIVEYIIENTQYPPAYDEYERYERLVGDDGYPMINCGDCPMHHWMRALAGYDRAYFHLNDFPEKVEHLLTVLTQRFKDALWPRMLESPARLLMHGHHLSSQMTPPPLFEQYILPYYRELTPPLRERGKVVAMHGDNDTRQILALIRQSGIGMVECFVTEPMVPTTMAEARAAWEDEVIVWGGVPSVMLEDMFTDEQFERFMDGLFRTIAPGKAFIMGIADNAMPTSRIDRICRITEMIEQRGTYPIASE